MGPPWSLPFEFPLYQWIVAAGVSLFDTSIDSTGRFVSLCFFYLCFIALFSLLGSLGIRRRERLLFFSLLLVSPLYLFWSRTFMIESTALFFSIAYLAIVARLFPLLGGVNTSNRPVWILLAVVCGALGALIKVTTFWGFLLIGTLFVALGMKKDFRDKSRWVSVFLLLFIPVVAALLWTRFADAQKSLNPLVPLPLNSFRFCSQTSDA
ncbi:MAG: phospholipid carrier-dependent glycosyltransferase, partial [Bdellovibrionota bacterium]